eukprot:1920505-Alexandrium_andersonii.AAC.1
MAPPPTPPLDCCGRCGRCLAECRLHPRVPCACTGAASQVANPRPTPPTAKRANQHQTARAR